MTAAVDAPSGSSPDATAPTDPPGPPIPPAPSSAARSRGLGRGRFGRPGFSIQSKLLVMLLIVSVGASVVTGIVGYLSGSDSLRQASFERLTEVRESRAREITNYYEQTRDSLVVYTRGTTVVDAMNGSTTPSTNWRSSLRTRRAQPR